MSLEDRRAALVAATEPLLEQYGRDVSTRQIAEAAGVAEGTIFRAFATKEELIDAVLQEVFDEARTRAAVGGVDRSLPLEERLTAAVTILQDRTRRVFALFHALRLRPGWAGGDEHDGHSHDDLRARQRRDQEAMEEVLVELIGPDAAHLRMPARDAVTVLRASVFALTHPLLGGGESLSRPERIVDLVLHGIVRHHPEESTC